MDKILDSLLYHTVPAPAGEFWLVSGEADSARVFSFRVEPVVAFRLASLPVGDTRDTETFSVSPVTADVNATNDHEQCRRGYAGRYRNLLHIPSEIVWEGSSALSFRGFLAGVLDDFQDNDLSAVAWRLENRHPGVEGLFVRHRDLLPGRGLQLGNGPARSRTATT